MKKTIFSTFLVTSLFFTAIPALAEDPTPTLRPGQQLRQELKEERKELREEKKSALSELKKKVLTNIYTNIKNRLTKRYEYLQDRKTKVSDRIAKKEQAGKDITAAKVKLAEFDNYKTPYTNNLTALEAKFQEVLVSEKPLSQVPQLRQAAQKVWDDLKSMHQVLINALKLIVKA